MVREFQVRNTFPIAINEHQVANEPELDHSGREET